MADGSSSAVEDTKVYNMPKLMNSVNRTSEYRNVDNQGNAQMYTIGMKLYGTLAGATIKGAPDTYYVRRAVKAWHDARVMMYKRAGIRMKDLGYGRDLRPYLNVNHENGTTEEVVGNRSTSGSDLGHTFSPVWVGDEWTYSRAAVATPAETTSSGNINEFDLVDTYSFTLLDSSVTEDTTPDSPDESGSTTDEDSFVSVGMIAEWLDSFKRSAKFDAGNSAGTATLDSNNALVQLRSQQGADKEEVLELVEDAQKEKRPWQLSGASYSEGGSTRDSVNQ